MNLDRRKAPESQPFAIRPLTIPEKIQTRNGGEIITFKSDIAPIVYLEILFESGRWWESPFGVSYYAAKMLLEGTNDMSAAEISAKFEYLGSFIQVAPGTDYVSLKLFALKKNFGESLNLLINLLGNARFPQKEFDRLQQIRHHDITNQLSKNSRFATAKFLESLFGPTHPYGQITQIESIQDLTLGTVKDYKTKMLLNRPKAMLVGDLTNEPELLVAALESLDFHHLASPVFRQEKQSEHQIIAREESAQASIRCGANTIPRHHEDIHKLMVANLIFGGFFGSRLMKNIREEKGLTYGISSQIIHLTNASYLMISAEVEQSKAKEVLDEIHNEVDLLSKVPPSASEIATATNYAKGKYLASMDSPLSTAALLKNSFLFGLPVSYQSEFIDTLDQITGEEICEVASKYLKPEILVSVN